MVRPRSREMNQRQAPTVSEQAATAGLATWNGPHPALCTSAGVPRLDARPSPAQHSDRPCTRSALFSAPRAHGVPSGAHRRGTHRQGRPGRRTAAARGGWSQREGQVGPCRSGRTTGVSPDGRAERHGRRGRATRGGRRDAGTIKPTTPVEAVAGAASTGEASAEERLHGRRQRQQGRGGWPLRDRERLLGISAAGPDANVCPGCGCPGAHVLRSANGGARGGGTPRSAPACRVRQARAAAGSDAPAPGQPRSRSCLAARRPRTTMRSPYSKPASPSMPSR